jgi:anti-anti-sigma factor
MSFHFVSHPWEVQDVQDGTLVVFTERDLDPVTVSVLTDELYELVLESGQPNLYLDFGQIHNTASIVVGKLIALDTRLRQVGGRLILCNLDPQVYEFFRVANVTQILDLRVNECLHA